MAAVIGIPAVIAASATAFAAVKVVGAGYLIWLGVQHGALAITRCLPTSRPPVTITSLAGEGVTGVDIVGADGVIVVRATVERGWFTAWWPGGSGGEVEDQDTVTVHTGETSTSFAMVETYADPD
jgi:hypothetical protein